MKRLTYKQYSKEHYETCDYCGNISYIVDYKCPNCKAENYIDFDSNRIGQKLIYEFHCDECNHKEEIAIYPMNSKTLKSTYGVWGNNKHKKN